MAWTIKFDAEIEKHLRGIEKTMQRRIMAFLFERLAPRENPRSIGKALSGALKSFWRYRVGDYRIICDIQDGTITILVLAIGNRKQVYKHSPEVISKT